MNSREAKAAVDHRGNPRPDLLRHTEPAAGRMGVFGARQVRALALMTCLIVLTGAQGECSFTGSGEFAAKGGAEQSCDGCADAGPKEHEFTDGGAETDAGSDEPAPPLGFGTPGATGAAVRVTPGYIRIQRLKTTGFVASVTYPENSPLSNTGVVWRVEGDESAGTISQTGDYIAPAAPGTYTVTATSVVDPTAFARAVIEVTPSLAITPSYAVLGPMMRRQFEAHIEGVSTREEIVWSIDEGEGPETGRLVNGLYEAPAVENIIHLRATSRRDPWLSTAVVVEVRNVAGHALELVVPPSSSEPKTMGESVEFIWKGAGAGQTGVEEDAIDTRQVAIVRGRVRDRDARGFPGVRVSALGHPEFGNTYTRADGMFDFAVQGGATYTISLDVPGYIPVQRNVTATPQDWSWVEDVVLIPYDPAGTVVDFATSTTMQIAQGSLVKDEDGVRTASILIPKGTRSTMTLADGTMLPLGLATVRATEYTVGASGPAAMPAMLPDGTAYTYCVEFSMDEAVAAGAVRVDFSQPVITYVDNFLGFEPGTPVPSGYYDRQAGQWRAEPDGVVISVLDIDEEGLALVDTDGDGYPDDEDTLRSLEVSVDERSRLAELYPKHSEAFPKELWRVAVRHFSPYDFNWPNPPGAPTPDATADCPYQDHRCENEKDGSIIECDTRALGKRVALSGTGMFLDYRSSRTPGRSGEVVVQVTGPEVPPGVVSIRVEIQHGGEHIDETMAPVPNIRKTYRLKNVNAYGQPLHGSYPVVVGVDYNFDGMYGRPDGTGRSFGGVAGEGANSGFMRQGYRTRKTIVKTTQHWDARYLGLGGWTLSSLHRLDVVGNTIQKGDGSTQNLTGIGPQLRHVAGSDVVVELPDNATADAKEIALWPIDIAFSPQGELYVADGYSGRVLSVNDEGLLAVVAGKNECASWDSIEERQPPGLCFGARLPGNAAKSACLLIPTSLAFDPMGHLYVGDGPYVRRVSGGNVSYFAGTGEPDRTAVDDDIARFTCTLGMTPQSLAFVGGALHVSSLGRVYRLNGANVDDAYWGEFETMVVQPPGPVVSLSASGSSLIGFLPSTNSGSPGLGPGLGYWDLARFSNRLVTRLVRNVVGADPHDVRGNDDAVGFNLVSAISGYLAQVSAAVGPDGSIYYGSAMEGCIRRVGPDGNVAVVAGYCQEVPTEGAEALTEPVEGPALGAALPVIRIAVSADGRLFFSSVKGVWEVVPPGAERLGETFRLPSGDGSLLYVFDESGRHLETIDTQLGNTVAKFHYDGPRLIAVEDRYGERLTFEYRGQSVFVRNSSDTETVLLMNSDGYLREVQHPGGRKDRYDYSKTQIGLLERSMDPNGNSSAYSYDDAGYLAKATGPDGSMQTLSATETSSGAVVVHRSQEGRETRYETLQSEDGSTTESLVRTPDNLTHTTISRGGNTETIAPDGTTVTQMVAADPRFGMNAPYTSHTMTVLSSGRSYATRTTKEATLADAGDPLSLLTLTIKTDTSENGNPAVSTATFDRASRTWTFESPEGRQMVQKLDAKGRISRVEAPGVLPLIYRYDARGRLEAVQQGDRETRSSYDSRGRLKTVTDAENYSVGMRYDGADRVTRLDLADGVNYTEFSYDQVGNMMSLIPPGRPEHTFAYTPNNLESKYTAPAVGSIPRETTKTYDKEKVIQQEVRPDGSLIRVVREPVSGRVTAIQRPDGLVSYQYDEHGKPRFTTTPDGVSTAYSWEGPLLRSVAWAQGSSETGTVSYDYDDAWRVKSVQVNGESPVTYEYDRDGLMTRAGELWIGRDPDTGFVSHTALGVVEDLYEYNDYGEVMRYTAWSNGNTVFQIEYLERDRLGRIVLKRESVRDEVKTLRYAYDARGRLETVHKVVDDVDVLVSRYVYDSNGNRLSHETPSGTNIGTYDDQDRLLTYGNSTYTYTHSGDMRTKNEGGQVTTYTYDVGGSLRKVEVPKVEGGYDVVEYLVDAQGRRMARKLNGQIASRYLWDGQFRLLAELDELGEVRQRFVYSSGINLPEYVVHKDRAFRFVGGDVGDRRLLVDPVDGEIVQDVGYDAFGLAEGEWTYLVGFAGGVYDEVTELVRFGSRDYNPRAGRWVSKDPLLFGGGESNLYVYVGNDPIQFVDPDGRVAIGRLLARFGSAPVWLGFGLGATFSALIPGPTRDALLDFRFQHDEMQRRNIIGSDKYYHCMANCRSSRRSLGGKFFAEFVSEAREFVQEHVVGESKAECDLDRAANEVGRNAEGICELACASTVHRDVYDVIVNGVVGE